MTPSDLQEVRAEIRRVLDAMLLDAARRYDGADVPMLRAGVRYLDEQAPPPEPAAADCPVCLKPTAVSVAAGQKPFGLCQCKNEPAPGAPVAKCCDDHEPDEFLHKHTPAAPRPPSGDLSELRAAQRDYQACEIPKYGGSWLALRKAADRMAVAIERHIAAAQAEQGEL